MSVTSKVTIVIGVVAACGIGLYLFPLVRGHQGNNQPPEDPEQREGFPLSVLEAPPTPEKYDIDNMMKYTGRSCRRERLRSHFVLCSIADTDENDTIIDKLLSSEGIPFVTARAVGRGWSIDPCLWGAPHCQDQKVA